MVFFGRVNPIIIVAWQTFKFEVIINFLIKELRVNLLVFFVFTVFDALLEFPVVPDVLELLVNYGLLGLGPVGF